jgi:hypothetical protein
MAKLKMLKLPKKPKKNASVATKENYLSKVDEVRKENTRRTKENARSIELDKKIAAIRPGVATKTARKTTRKRKSPAKKKSVKRRRR